MSEFTFHKKGGRPRSLSKKEAYESQLEAKRRWREKNKERLSVYNELYRNKKSRKSRHSRKASKSRKSRKGSRIMKLLKVNRDGSKIVLIK